MQFFDVNTYLYLWRASKLSWSDSWFLLSLTDRTRFYGPHFTLSFLVNISILISSTSMCFFVFELMVLSPTFSNTFLKFHIIFRICSLEIANCITSSTNLKFTRTFLFSFVNVVFRPSKSIEALRWTAAWTSDLLAYILSGCRKCCSLCVSMSKPSALCISSSGDWRTRDRRCKIWVSPK